jgi:outer membrane protein
MTISSRLASLAAVVPAAVLAWGGMANAQGGLPALPTTWDVGGLVITAPKYEGSSKHRVMGIPIAIPAGTGDGRLQFKAPDDVRLRLVSLHGFEFGPVAGWRFGRDEDDGNRLRGLGDVDGGLVLGGYAAWRFGPLAAFASYNHQVMSDDTGGLLRFGLEANSSLPGRISLTTTVGATWASEDYMQAFFGVSAFQATRSGLGFYRPEAGIKDVFAGLSAELPLNDRWTLRAFGRYAHLVGDAASSPIVEREGQLSGGLGLTYRVSFGR